LADKSSLDEITRYVKKRIPKELWLEARSLAVKKGKTVTNWMIEAIKEKIARENK
jgi:hypothetical protein